MRCSRWPAGPAPPLVAGEVRIGGFGGVDVLVTKDARGPHTDAKLAVAAERGAAVVMIRRPASPLGCPR